MGRPSKGEKAKTAMVCVRMTADEVALVDNFIAEEVGIGIPRSAAIRLLMVEGVKAVKAKKEGR